MLGKGRYIFWNALLISDWWLTVQRKECSPVCSCPSRSFREGHLLPGQQRFSQRGRYCRYEMWDWWKPSAWVWLQQRCAWTYTSHYVIFAFYFPPYCNYNMKSLPIILVFPHSGKARCWCGRSSDTEISQAHRFWKVQVHGHRFQQPGRWPDCIFHP